MKVIIKKILFCTIFSFLLNMPVDQSWYKSILKSTKDFVLDHQNKFIFGALITGLVGIAAWAGWKFWKSPEGSEKGISLKEMLMTDIKVASDPQKIFRKRPGISSRTRLVQKTFEEDEEFTKIFNDRGIWKKVKDEVWHELFEEIKKKNQENKQTAKSIPEQKIEESISLSQSIQEIPITESIKVNNQAIDEIEEKILDTFKTFFLKKNIVYYYSKDFFTGGIGESNINKFLKILNIPKLIEDNKNEKNFIEKTLEDVFLTYWSWYPEMIKRYIEKRFEEQQPIEGKRSNTNRFFKNKRIENRAMEDEKPENNSEDMMFELPLEVPQADSVDTILKKLFEEEEQLINLKEYSDQSTVLFNISKLFQNLNENNILLNKIKKSKILAMSIFHPRNKCILDKDSYFIDFNHISKIQDNKKVAKNYITLLKNEQRLKKEKESSLIEE